MRYLISSANGQSSQLRTTTWKRWGRWIRIRLKRTLKQSSAWLESSKERQKSYEHLSECSSFTAYPCLITSLAITVIQKIKRRYMAAYMNLSSQSIITFKCQKMKTFRRTCCLSNHSVAMKACLVSFRVLKLIKWGKHCLDTCKSWRELSRILKVRTC